MDREDSVSIITYCKNHPEVPSRFFASEQPWIKYCQQCALNMALCGRNISQDFTTEEFERKMQIASIVNQLKHQLQQSDDNQAYYSKIMALLQQGAQPLNQRIKDLTESIEELTKTRNNLQKLYEKEIGGKISQYTERQSKMIINCRDIKAQLEHIQSNFTHFIANQDQFEEYREQWKMLASRSKKEILTEDEFNEGKQKVLDVMQSFYSEIEKLSNFSMGVSLESRQALRTDQTFDMVLTPVDSNSLNSTIALDRTGFQKNKRELKLKMNKRNQTERDSCSKQKISKRASLCGIQNRDISCIDKFSK